MSTGGEKGKRFSSLVRLSGDFRTRGTSTSDFTIDFGAGLQNVDRVSFVTCEFPNNFYNVVSGINNLFHYIVSTGSFFNEYNHLISPGYYNIDDLLAVLNAFIVDDASTDVTLMFDSKGSKKVGATPPTIGVNFLITNVVVGAPVDTTIWPLLGFVPNQAPINGVPVIAYQDPAGGDGVVAPDLPALRGLTEAYVQSAALSPGNSYDEKGSIKNVGLCVPINAGFGGLVIFECKQDPLCQVTYPTSRNIQSIDIQLVDRYGSVLDLQGGNFKLDLRVWYNSK